MKSIVAVICLLVALGGFQRATANSTWTPTTTSDNVGGSLRQAILAANNTASSPGAPNTIYLPPGVYSVLDTELVVGSTTNLCTIFAGQGTPLDTTIQHSGKPARVFDINPTQAPNLQVTFQNVTISGGVAGANGGGAILGGGNANSLTLSNCTIDGNRTLPGYIGGGICWGGGGDLVVKKCIFSNNTATNAVGGAICFDNGNGNPGNLSISNTVFSGNDASGGVGAGQGGALFLSLDKGSIATITGCKFTANMADTPISQGGGLYATSGTITVHNGLFSGNTALNGNDTFNNGGATLTIFTDPPPQITVQPLSQSDFIGTLARFSVTVSNADIQGYQWLRNGIALSDGGRIAGSSSNTLTLQIVTPVDQALYSVVVSNAVGSATSSNAQLTVVLVHPTFSAIPLTFDGPYAYFNGTAGAPNGQYAVLTSTNVAAPLTSWTAISTNQFDDTGAFFFSDAVTPDQPNRFYLLRIP